MVPLRLSHSAGLRTHQPISMMVVFLEALRKPLGGSSITKFTLGRRSKFAKHQVNVAQVDHRGGGFRFALIVFAVPSRPAIPRVRALHHPAFAHGQEPCGAFRPGLYPDLCSLYRLTIDTRGAGGGLSPRFPTHPLPQGRQYLGPGSIITPLRKI